MLRELIVFVIAALVFGGIMYLWFEWQEYRGNGHYDKLKRKFNVDDYVLRDEIMKELDNGIGEPYSKDLESAAERYNKEEKLGDSD